LAAALAASRHESGGETADVVLLGTLNSGTGSFPDRIARVATM
jgi:hypothetical protein